MPREIVMEKIPISNFTIYRCNETKVKRDGS